MEIYGLLTRVGDVPEGGEVSKTTTSMSYTVKHSIIIHGSEQVLDGMFLVDQLRSGNISIVAPDLNVVYYPKCTKETLLGILHNMEEGK